jgi:hypothetical protein
MVNKGERRMAKAKVVSEVTNGGKATIEYGLPYAVYVTVEGASDLLFHRWNCEAVDAKSKAAKNSVAKKTDDIESYLWRNSENEICIPGEYFRQALIHAAKFRQDPRSPRKSAMDLFKAGVVSLTGLASLGSVKWDYLDTRRVMIQRAGVNRTRPAMQMGWKAKLEFQVLTPEYIEPVVFQEVLNTAGRLVGVGDFRPTFGRFFIKSFEISS